MAWQDRIREAAYTGPDGTRIVFTYENVGVAVDKKTSAFEFPDADGTYIQDLGRTGRRYPLQVIFHGNDYDITANAFLALLEMRGAGTLEHPAYGQVQVVPFGEITRRDDLKTASNQAIFEVVFWETIDDVYPTQQIDRGAQALQALAEYNNAQAEQTADNVLDRTATQAATFRSEFRSVLDQTRASLNDAIAVLRGDNPINAIYQTLNRVLPDDSITSIVGQVNLMIQTGARFGATNGSTENLLTTFSELLEQRTGISFGAGDQNEFINAELYAGAYLAGRAVTLLNTEFSTKSRALRAAETILDEFEQFGQWRDTQFDNVGVIDTGESYQPIQELVSLVAGFLVEISFSLREERRITLGRARSVIDLVAELYGEIDSQLDFFINSNRLTGSEILEVPRGRTIVYYV